MVHHLWAQLGEVTGADANVHLQFGRKARSAQYGRYGDTAIAPLLKLPPGLLFVTLLLACISPRLHGQSPSAESAWSATFSLNNYIFADDYIIMPVVQAGVNRLHLEARYNYEDLRTASFFGGYDFTIGEDVTLDITPMLGIAFGQSAGIIPAVELTLACGAFSLYNESEFLVSAQGREESFFYSWSEFTYAPLPWLNLGLVATRTRLYKTDLDLQRGIGAGIAQERFGITGYLMNAGFDAPFGYLSAWASF